MEIRAKLLEKFDEVKVSETFRKREFIAEYSEKPQYPEYLKFEMIQDKCDLLNGFEAGQEVDIFFNLKGRKWINPKGETVYFNSLQAWKLLGSGEKQGSAPDKNQEPPPLDAYEKDEIPF
ncbi:MAG: DUF3127 domain-containing protein [Deltaproteobacteria bacterium]|jgi:hypothetical protein|nr:DUF3127 domain-containing protein [Deltaproteobacteria bacterium]